MTVLKLNKNIYFCKALMGDTKDLCGSITMVMFILGILVGLPTYLHGCDPYVGGYCDRYITKEFTVTQTGDYLYGYVIFPVNNVTTEREYCELLTGKAYGNEYKKQEANKKNYPEGYTEDVYFDELNGLCRLKSYASDLGIVGFAFLLYPTVVTIIGFLFVIITCVCGCCKYTKENINPGLCHCISRCMECINCYSWCDRVCVCIYGKNTNVPPITTTHTTDSIANESTQVQMMERNNAQREKEQIKNLDKKPSNYYERVNTVIKSECSTCLSQIEPGKKYLVYECGHQFHEKCGKEWISKNKSNPTCPFCRGKIAFASNV